MNFSLSGDAEMVGMCSWGMQALQGSPSSIASYQSKMTQYAGTLAQIEQGFLNVKTSLGETWSGSGSQASQRLAGVISSNLASTQSATTGVGAQAGAAGNQLQQLQTLISALTQMANVIIAMGKANPETLPAAISQAQGLKSKGMAATAAAQTGSFAQVAQSILGFVEKLMTAQNTPQATPLSSTGPGTAGGTTSPYTPGSYGGNTTTSGNGYTYYPPNGFPYTGNKTATPPPGTKLSGWQPITNPAQAVPRGGPLQPGGPWPAGLVVPDTPAVPTR